MGRWSGQDPGSPASPASLLFLIAPKPSGVVLDPLAGEERGRPA